SVLIIWREKNWEVPLESILHAFRAPAHRIVRPDIDVALLPRVMIEPFEQAAVIAAEDDVGIFRMRLHPARFAAGGLLPISDGDAGAGRAAGDLDRRVVLLRAVDVIGEIVIERDAIELARRLIL